jgi:hypothetical protein
LLSSFQGGVCGESSCFKITNVDGSGKDGAEILYASLLLFLCAQNLFFFSEHMPKHASLYIRRSRQEDGSIRGVARLQKVQRKQEAKTLQG